MSNNRNGAPKGFVSVRRGAELAGIELDLFRQLAYRGHLPRRKVGRTVYVERKAVMGLQVPDGYLTAEEAAEREGSTVSSISRRVRSKELNAFRRGGRYWVDPAGLTPVPAPPPDGWLTTNEVGDATGATRPQIYAAIKRDGIQTHRHQGKLYLPPDCIRQIADALDGAKFRASEEAAIAEGFRPAGWVAKRQGTDYMTIRGHAERGNLSHRRVGRRLFVRPDEVAELLARRDAASAALEDAQAITDRHARELDGWVLLPLAADMLDISRQAAFARARSGTLPTARIKGREDYSVRVAHTEAIRAIREATND